MRKTATTSAIAAGLAALTAAVAVNLGGAGHPTARAQAGPPPPCGVHKVAAPAVVPLGYSTRVTLTVRTSCVLSDAVPTHIVLVVDASGSMADDGKLTATKQALDAFIRTLDLPARPHIQVALVKYSSVATTLCKLTNSQARLGACIRKLDAAGGSDVDAGIRTGMREMTAGRARGVLAGSTREVMVVLSDGPNNAGCGPVLQSAGQAKSQGIVMSTVAVGGDAVDVGCLALAASPGWARTAPTPADLDPVLQELARLVAVPFISWLTVVDTLPANMRLVPGTVQSLPDVGEPDGRGLTWRWSFVPAGVFTMSYAVTPLELGEHPVNVAAEAELSAAGRRDKLVFLVPRVRVVDSSGLATATAIPTLTPGSPPTVVPSPFPTPRPSPTATATTMPIGARECPGLARLAPAQAIADALANPSGVAGWDQSCNPSLPPGPHNPPRTTLGLQTASKPYHPVFNGLVFKCGCP